MSTVFVGGEGITQSWRSDRFGRWANSQFSSWANDQFSRWANGQFQLLGQRWRLVGWATVA